VEEGANPFKESGTLQRSGNLILGKRVLHGFAHTHGMETDFITLILIVDEENEAIIFGKGLIDEHDGTYQ
jgi:hypothetical protein